MKEPKGERIAKVMAHRGYCSRREAERWIEDGRVEVDGAIITTPATLVTATSKIVIDGTPVASKPASRLWLYHKPKGLITSHYDPQGRPTVFDHLPGDLPRVISVGRLDFNTEGLLLLTNDGEVARKMELPSTGWKRTYRIRAFGNTDISMIQQELAKGITIDGIHYAPAKLILSSRQGQNSWLEMTITEGKNREVRRILDYYNLTVNRLIRIAYGPYELGKLAPEQVKEAKIQ